MFMLGGACGEPGTNETGPAAQRRSSSAVNLPPHLSLSSFVLFLLRTTPRTAQGLLLILHPGITLSGAEVNGWGAEIKLGQRNARQDPSPLYYLALTLSS